MSEQKLKSETFMVGDYLVTNHGASHLATFPIVAGLMWTGRGGGGELVGTERMVHPLLLHRVDLDIGGVDMIMIPEGDDETNTNLLSMLYTGRYKFTRII